MSYDKVFEIRKSPTEKIPHTIEFKKTDRNATEWIVESCDVTAKDKNGNDATSTVIVEDSATFSGNAVTFVTQGGVDDEAYRIYVEAIMTTPTPNKAKFVATGYLYINSP